MKTCSKCKRELPLSEFYKNKTTADGYQAVCKECLRSYHKSNDSVGGGSSSELSGVKSRDLIEELKRRGYKWSSMWLEKVTIEKRYVKI